LKTGIIGLPQVGKTSLFQILTKAAASPSGDRREGHLGVAKVPDDRLAQLAALFKPKKLTYVSVEYVDVAAIGAEALKETAYATTLRNVDALAHVVRAFEDPSIPHVGSLDPARDIGNVEVDLIVNDLGQVEKRLERLVKDLKRAKEPEIQREMDLLKRAKEWLESERALRELEISPDDKKRIRGFTFLSEKPILYVVNVGENEAGELDHVIQKYQLEAFAAKPNVGVTAICGKMEAELTAMQDEEAAEFLAGYGLKESGLVRLIRKTYELMGFISFFTVGEDECRAWTIPRGSRAVEAAGAIHTDLSKHFIRAETIRWDELLEAGSEANARSKGKLRLEGKDYVVQDGDVLHIRHSG